MAIPLKNPETKQEILGYWILQVLEFHARLQKHRSPTPGDWMEMNALSSSLSAAAIEAEISLEIRPGTIYAGKRHN